MMDDWMDVVFTFIMGALIFFFAIGFTKCQTDAENNQIEKGTSFMKYDSMLLQFVKSTTNNGITADIISEASKQEGEKKIVYEYLYGIIPSLTEAEVHSALDKQAEDFFSKQNVVCRSLIFLKEDVQMYSINDSCYNKDWAKMGKRGIVTKVADAIIPIAGKPSENIKIELFIKE